MIATTMGKTKGLVKVAADINTEHEAIVQAVRSALEHARRCGELLIEAKAQIGHGQWLPWLDEHCPTISQRTAQGYMRVTRRWPELEDAQRVADLPLRNALKLLAAPSVHDRPVGTVRTGANTFARLLTDHRAHECPFGMATTGSITAVVVPHSDDRYAHYCVIHLDEDDSFVDYGRRPIIRELVQAVLVEDLKFPVNEVTWKPFAEGTSWDYNELLFDSADEASRAGWCQ